MAFSKKVTFQIDATDSASSKFKSLEGSMSKLNHSTMTATTGISKYGAMFSNVASGIMTAAKYTVVSITAIGVAAGLMTKKAIDAFVEMENSMTGLSSVAKAFKQDVDATKEAARNLARDGLMSVADSSRGLKNLLAAGFGLPEAIKLMTAFKDSAAFNRQGSLEFGEAIVGATEGIKNGNSILVDNAGITKNLSVILKEAGFSAQDLMNASSDASVRQAIFNGILKESASFSGDAGRAAETMGGKISQASTSFFELKALIGESLAPVVGNIIDKFKNFTNSLTYLDENGIKRLNPEVQKLVENISKLAGDVIEKIVKSIANWVDKMGGPEGVYNKLVDIWTIIDTKVIPFIQAFGTVVSTVVKIIVAVFSGLQKVLETVFLGWFMYMDKMKSSFDKFKDAWSNAVNGMKAIFTSVWDSIKAGIVDGINYMVKKINSLISKINKLPGVNIGKISEIEAKAEGGPVSGRNTYLVGEQGPELFTPTQSGTIIPNNQLGGSTFNFNFQGAVISDKSQLISEIKQAINRELELSRYGIG